MTRLRMAVIGVGHLGKEHARILAGMSDVELVGVADINAEQAQTVAQRHDTRAYTDYWPLLSAVDAVCIAVPTIHHFAVATQFLRRGVQALVEKPLASNLADAQALVNLAEQKGVILQVGHIERFNPAIEGLQSVPLQPKYIRCERLGPFTGRSTDIGVVLDLMIHDLDLLLMLLQSPVKSVDALGVSVFGGHEDVANARLHFVNGCVADLTASRASMSVKRSMRVWAAEGYAKIDFHARSLMLVQPTPYLREHGIDPRWLDPSARERLKDELFTRFFQTLEVNGQDQDQLTAELKHFVNCVRTKTTPRVTGATGRDAIAISERILESLHQHHWNGIPDGPTGPHGFPEPLGMLFGGQEKKEAA